MQSRLIIHSPKSSRIMVTAATVESLIFNAQLQEKDLQFRRFATQWVDIRVPLHTSGGCGGCQKKRQRGDPETKRRLIEGVKEYILNCDPSVKELIKKVLNTNEVVVHVERPGGGRREASF